MVQLPAGTSPARLNQAIQGHIKHSKPQSNAEQLIPAEAGSIPANKSSPDASRRHPGAGSTKASSIESAGPVRLNQAIFNRAGERWPEAGLGEQR